MSALRELKVKTMLTKIDTNLFLNFGKALVALTTILCDHCVGVQRRRSTSRPPADVIMQDQSDVLRIGVVCNRLSEVL